MNEKLETKHSTAPTDTELFTKNSITEVNLELKIDPIPSIEELEKNAESLHSEIKNDFPDKKPTYHTDAFVDIEKSEHTVQKGLYGYHFWSEDKKDVFLCYRDKYSFSRLRPYKSWNAHQPQMLKGWKSYNKFFTPSNITGFALRYINLFQIPERECDLNTYFKLFPQLSNPIEDLRVISDFFQKLVLHGNDGIQVESILVAPRPPQNNNPKDNQLSVLLDIRASKRLSIQIKDEHLKKVEKELDSLHNYAEKVFLGCITEKTKELIR